MKLSFLLAVTVWDLFAYCLFDNDTKFLIFLSCLFSDEQERVQKKTFTNWMNTYLKQVRKSPSLPKLRFFTSLAFIMKIVPTGMLGTQLIQVWLEIWIFEILSLRLTPLGLFKNWDYQCSKICVANCVMWYSIWAHRHSCLIVCIVTLLVPNDGLYQFAWCELAVC